MPLGAQGALFSAILPSAWLSLFLTAVGFVSFFSVSVSHGQYLAQSVAYNTYVQA